MFILYIIYCIKHVYIECCRVSVRYSFTIRSRLNVAKIEYWLIITVEIYATANGKSRPCVFINFINYLVQEQIPFNFDSHAMEIIIASSHPSRWSIIIP